MQAFRRALPQGIQRTAARTFTTTAPRPMAKLTALGRLTDSPEVTVSSNGREYLTYTVVTNHGPKDNRSSSFWNVRCFVEGSQKDYITNLPKGALVYLEGDIQNNTYQDDEGKTRRAINIIHRQLQLLSRPQNREEDVPSA